MAWDSYGRNSFVLGRHSPHLKAVMVRFSGGRSMNYNVCRIQCSYHSPLCLLILPLLLNTDNNIWHMCACVFKSMWILYKNWPYIRSL